MPILNHLRVSCLAIFICLFLMTALLTPDTAKADCAAPSFPTHCVKAKVLKQLKPDPNIAQRFQHVKKFCKVGLSTTSFQGEMYLFLKEEKPCPRKGETLLGDLGIPCNDAGQDNPQTFRLKTPEVCKRETAERLQQQKLTDASSILITRTQVKPSKFEKEYTLVAANLTSYRNNCVLPLMQKKQLSMEQKYRFEVSYLLRRKTGETQKGTLENLAIKKLTKGLPDSVLRCFEKEVEKKRSYLENAWIDLPETLQVKVMMRFGKKT